MQEWNVEATGMLCWMGKVWADSRDEAEQAAKVLARQFGESFDWALEMTALGPHPDQMDLFAGN